MNTYNPLESTKRLEAAGLDRRQAEAIASEINTGTSDLVTKEYFKDQLEAALSKAIIRMGTLMSIITAIATGILGILITLN